MKLKSKLKVTILAIAASFSITAHSAQTVVEDFMLGSKIDDIPDKYTPVDKDGKESDKPMFSKGKDKQYFYVLKSDLNKKEPSTFQIYEIDGVISLENIILKDPAEFDNIQAALKKTMGRPIATSAGVKNEPAFRLSPYYCGVPGKQACSPSYFEIYHSDTRDYLLVEVKSDPSMHFTAGVMLSGITPDGADMIARMSKQ